MSVQPILNPGSVKSYDPRVAIVPVRLPVMEEDAQAEGSPWSRSFRKRLFDLSCVVTALLLLWPILLVVAMIVRLDSEGPVLFRQKRVGLYRRTFTIYKFRTMSHDRTRRGPCVTKAGDTRFTALGRFLRKYKLDELPQLYNVLRGDMSLVGPRPKLPQHEHLAMHYRPGITGAATLAFAEEEHLLKTIPDEELEEFHVRVVSPIKKLLDQQYQEQATFSSDLRLLIDTILKRRECLDMRTLLAWHPFTSRMSTQYLENVKSSRY